MTDNGQRDWLKAVDKWYTKSLVGQNNCFTQYELNTLRELCEKHGIVMQPIWTMRATDQYKYFGSPAWMQMEAEGHPYYEENLNRAAY